MELYVLDNQLGISASCEGVILCHRDQLSGNELGDPAAESSVSKG